MPEDRDHLCPSCHAETEKHCDSPTCNWWRCKDLKNCDTFGDARRHACRKGIS